MMNRISTAAGLDNTITALIQHITEVIGGTNIILYYLVDGNMQYADIYGARKQLTTIDDTLIQQVVANHQPIETEQPFSKTKMRTPEFAKAYTWIFPLLVGPELVGIIKMENLHIAMQNLYKKLPTFFAYAALILKNEITGHARLQKINSELEQANEKLMRQQVFLEAIMENIADGIVACDEKGLLTMFNKATREFHGREQKQLPADQWAHHYDLFLADGVTPMQTKDIPLYKAFMGEEVNNIEMVIAPEHGKTRTLLASGKTMLDENGNKLGAVVSMHDITERKQAEVVLQKAHDELEIRVKRRTAELLLANEALHAEIDERKQTEKMLEVRSRELSLLLKEVNHRVKNNLAAITGMLYIERHHANKSLPQRSQADLLTDLTNRVKGLQTVHQLLSDSKWSPLPISTLTRRIINSALQALPQDRQIVTDIVSASPLEVAAKDAQHLAIIINELSTNVIKYAAPTKKLTRIFVRIDYKPQEKTIVFEFRDDGPGFPAAVLASEKRHVGMYLIENTVRHSLRGEIKIYNDNGAVVVILFSKEESSHPTRHNSAVW